jgi:hypothetical protein
MTPSMTGFFGIALVCLGGILTIIQTKSRPR